MDKKSNEQWACRFTKVKAVLVELDELISQIKADHKIQKMMEEPLSMKTITRSTGTERKINQLAEISDLSNIDSSSLGKKLDNTIDSGDMLKIITNELINILALDNDDENKDKIVNDLLENGRQSLINYQKDIKPKIYREQMNGNDNELMTLLKKYFEQKWEVEYVKPKVDGTPVDVTCLLNEIAKLNVKFTAIPKANITWYKADSTEIKADDHFQIITDDNGQSTLTINDATLQDSQSYTARATHKVRFVVAKVNLNVKAPPKVEASQSMNDQSCVIGQDTQISWKFSGIEKPQVTWFFNDQLLPTNDRFQVTETDDGTSTLSIHQAELADQGVYTARATNAVDEAKAKTTLNIVGFKTNLDAALQVTEGGIMTLKIVVKGTPKPNVAWMKGNDELTANDRIQVTIPTGDDDTYILTISNVQPKDQGEYSVKITHVSGSLKSNTCKVTVSSMS
ncbi:unnamed protein product [Rotaria sordida]|uniref:Ig-like domain-containing protein n=2 Tax=Rotaria sordida TaxID=392033 RepID=A0A814NG82_9BILA|nr:unnamed protein product [Rotaria sordida]